MIKKKAYEKQNMKTLYDNQGELIRKQNDFSNYGIENEYGFSDKRLDAKLQARNIIHFVNVEDLPNKAELGDGEYKVLELRTGSYLICGTRQMSGQHPTVTMNFDINRKAGYTDTLYNETGSQGVICLPFEIKEQGDEFSIFPAGFGSGTSYKYNLIFISL